MNKIIKNIVVEEAVYNLCLNANVMYSQDLYDKIYSEYESANDFNKKQKLYNILSNINEAYSAQRPLCQDTGQVILFLEIGSNLSFEGNIADAINSAVSKAYCENYFRKSVVKNALFNRVNTKNNTPAIIYTDYVDGDAINIKLMVKGAGSENYSSVKMFEPTADKEQIFKYIKSELERAGEKACPPYVLGIGVGGTMDYSAVMSKKAFFQNESDENEQTFVEELQSYLVKSGLSENVLDIKIKTSSTHIACLPVSLTINCHSTRHAQCSITQDGVVFKQQKLITKELSACNVKLDEVLVSDIDKIRALKTGDNILLSGEIYTARDAAHAKIAKYFKENNKLPFELKDKIIFYAGPCPAAPDEPIGPIGPTTSARMDKFTDLMYGNGVIATIGKGERSAEAAEVIKHFGGKYFTVQGGIACLLSKCVVSAEVVYFEELGTEAVRKLTVKNLPVCVEL